MAWRSWVVAACLIACVTGCDSRDGAIATVARSPQAIGDHECAVCGMLVRDQSAPRGQVVHRDGTRLYLCSLGDLGVHLGAPSPHGRVDDVFVEVLDPSEAPGQSHRGVHAWVPAVDATFVVGVPRPQIMGEPVLAYASEHAAAAVAARHSSARLRDFAELERGWRAEMRR